MPLVNDVVPSVVADVPVDNDAPEGGKELVGMVRDPIGAANVPEDAGREPELGLMAAGSDSAPVGTLTRIQIRKKSCMMVDMLSF